MRIVIEAIANVFRKPYTRKYPYTKARVFQRFRGRILYYPVRCIGCMQCAKNCPNNSIHFYKKGKINFDMNKCMYCGLCEDVCPTKPKAIKLTNEFEYADSDKEKVKKNVISAERFPGLEK